MTTAETEKFVDDFIGELNDGAGWADQIQIETFLYDNETFKLLPRPECIEITMRVLKLMVDKKMLYDVDTNSLPTDGSKPDIKYLVTSVADFYI